MFTRRDACTTVETLANVYDNTLLSFYSSERTRFYTAFAGTAALAASALAVFPAALVIINPYRHT